MAMDILSSAIQVANAVRLVIAAYQGESKVVLSARTLMRTCEQYQDSLVLLKTGLEEHNECLQGYDEWKLRSLYDQIRDDLPLLQEIADITKDVVRTTEQYSVIRNTFTTLITGRIDTIKELEQKLMVRVQTIMLMFTTLQASQKGIEHVLEVVQDPEGAIFWFRQFGTGRSVSLRRFASSYQAYLSATLLFRRFQQDHLGTLLRSTLLEDDLAHLPLSAALDKEVSLQAFSSWIKLYGPMRDTFRKAASVSLPSLDKSAIWFQRSATRQDAERIILANASAGSAITAEKLVIVRYSSKPEYHFAVSTLPPGLSQVQHLTVQNSPQGYIIPGEICSYAPTLVDCLQINLFDKLFKTEGGGRVALSRQTIDEWEKIFAEVTAELPADYYANVSDLAVATKQLDLGITENVDFGILSLVHRDEAVKSVSPPPPPPPAARPAQAAAISTTVEEVGTPGTNPTRGSGGFCLCS